MWICPKCGREFKRTNQGHYCGKAPETVLEYIASQPLETHSHLTEMMTALQNNVPYINERAAAVEECRLRKRRKIYLLFCL